MGCSSVREAESGLLCAVFVVLTQYYQKRIFKNFSKQCGNKEM